MCGRFATTTFDPDACRVVMIFVRSAANCCGESVAGAVPCEKMYFSTSFAPSHTVVSFGCRETAALSCVVDPAGSVLRNCPSTGKNATVSALTKLCRPPEVGSPGIVTNPQFGPVGGPESGPVIATASCIVMPGTPRSAIAADGFMRVAVHVAGEYAATLNVSHSECVATKPGGCVDTTICESKPGDLMSG